ncbi:hypothetical protein [Enterococcus gilvus]|uniref:hypothetical protein n=1 Tax=Enterococcus gilvus TaxID=160453 RepID=UPI0028D19EEF|nr:hypothetical protein [Enterococcus gilvus]
MNEEQQKAQTLMENQVDIIGFTLIQALTMGLSYYKAEYFEAISDKEFEEVVKKFVAQYM